MAKRLLLIAAGAFALTACTSTDVIDDVASTRNVIQFETAVNKPTRAAVDLDEGNLLQFHVFGFYTAPDEPTHAHAIFKHVPVNKSGGIWSYNTKEYGEPHWIPNATYYFYAYSCGSSVLQKEYGSLNVDMEAAERTLEIQRYTSDSKHQHDLVFASFTDYKAGATNEAVPFEFKHILSKLKARFTNTFSGEHEVVIKSVTVDDICNIGDYDFQTGWQDVDRKKNEQPLVYLLNASGQDAPDTPITVVSKNNPNGDKNKLVGESMAAFVIPNDYTSQSAEKVYLNVTIDVKLGSDILIQGKKLRATLNPKWEEGCYYIYNIELNADVLNMETIEFTVEKIEGWPDDDKATVTDATIEKPKDNTNDNTDDNTSSDNP